MNIYIETQIQRHTNQGTCIHTYTHSVAANSIKTIKGIEVIIKGIEVIRAITDAMMVI